MGLRQPLSSLLSKQSGNPLHCHPPGTHFPSAHMKFPGLLHSVVTLLPGSSWLSDGEEENRLLRLHSSKNWNAAFIPTARMGDSYRVHWVKIFKVPTNIWLILCRYRAPPHSNWSEERKVYIKCRYIRMCPQRSKITTLSRNPEPWTSLRYFWLTQQLGQNGLECETRPFGWGLTLCSKWMSSWPKTTLGRKEECVRFRPLYYT